MLYVKKNISFVTSHVRSLQVSTGRCVHRVTIEATSTDPSLISSSFEAPPLTSRDRKHSMNSSCAHTLHSSSLIPFSTLIGCQLTAVHKCGAHRDLLLDSKSRQRCLVTTRRHAHAWNQSWRMRGRCSGHVLTSIITRDTGWSRTISWIVLRIWNKLWQATVNFDLLFDYKYPRKLKGASLFQLLLY